MNRVVERRGGRYGEGKSRGKRQMWRERREEDTAAGRGQSLNRGEERCWGAGKAVNRGEERR